MNAGTEQATQTQSNDTEGRFTAIVYFHGMGNQRRYEELSRLVDALDQYTHNEHHKRKNSIGYLSNVEVRLEPLSGAADRTIGFIRAFLRNPSEPNADQRQQARFFEVYWAPVMAGQGGFTDIIKWMFRQVLRPFQTALSPWRERQRLRRAALISLFENEDKWPEGVEKRDFIQLVRTYHRFEGPAEIRSYERGSFEQFLAYLAQRFDKRPNTLKRLQTLAQLWRRRYARSELFSLFQMLTIALALVLAFGAGVGAILMFLQKISSWNWVTDITAALPQGISGSLVPNAKNATALLLFFASMIGLGRFLTLYMGDVQAWVTYEETDVKHTLRSKVIDTGIEVLKHALSNEKCERVVIVSHSLGTAVAQDTLLALTNFNRADPDHRQDPIGGTIKLSKISHFITLASPIDKIQYLFESYRSDHHRYKRVVEDIRGDIGTPPFSRNKKPYVHWMNFWDEGDIISGALHSPSSQHGLPNRVDNIHVRNFRFPAPGASHSGYFSNRRVIGAIFKVIFGADRGFASAPRDDRNIPNYDAVYHDAGEQRGSARFHYGVATVAVYAAAGWAVSKMWFPSAAVWFVAPLTLALITIAGAYLSSRALGHRDPI